MELYDATRWVAIVWSGLIAGACVVLTCWCSLRAYERLRYLALLLAALAFVGIEYERLHTVPRFWLLPLNAAFLIIATSVVVQETLGLVARSPRRDHE